MADKPSVLRPTDDEAIRQARILARGARFGAIGVLDPENGFPNASRVLVGTDFDACPIILISTLSAHTKGLAADPRCSLLVGEPGKGDPLAWPRMTIQALARKIARTDPNFTRLRQRFLSRHPKAALYVDFGDFAFFRLEPTVGNLNGGFGKAFRIEPADLLIESTASAAFAEKSDLIWAQISPSLETVGTHLAKAEFSENIGKWFVSNIDLSGIDISFNDKLRRFEFPKTLLNYEELINLYFNILKDIP